MKPKKEVILSGKAALVSGQGGNIAVAAVCRQQHWPTFTSENLFPWKLAAVSNKAPLQKDAHLSFSSYFFDIVNSTFHHAAFIVTQVQDIVGGSWCFQKDHLHGNHTQEVVCVSGADFQASDIISTSAKKKLCRGCGGHQQGRGKKLPVEDQ